MVGVKYVGRIVVIIIVVVVILVVCSLGFKGGVGSGYVGKVCLVVIIIDVDWKLVVDVLGCSGKFGDNNIVYWINLLCNDFYIMFYGVDIKLGLLLGGYVVFV